MELLGYLNYEIIPIMLTPWEVLSGDNSVNAMSTILHFPQLALVLRRGGIALCFVAIGVSVVKLLVYHDNKNRAELKENIKYKMLVIILIASMVTLFGLLKTVLDSVFGF